MTRKKQHQKNKTESPVTTADLVQEHKRKSKFSFIKSGKKFPYLFTFIVVWIFCTFTYGEVFTRTVQESYICSDEETMKFLTGQDYGTLYLYGRYLLLIFHNKWIGGLLLSLLLTLATFLFDFAFRFPKWLKGISILFTYALLLTWINKGISLYFKEEPSLFILQAMGLLGLSLILALISKLFTHWKKAQPSEEQNTPAWQSLPIGTLIVILGFIPVNVYALSCEENTILTAKMQNRVLANDTYALYEDGLSAKQASRSVAAYYAIGLIQSDLLLEHIFDISYHYPEVQTKDIGGTGEYGIFTADCNFYSGLLNAAYRSAMDQIVMHGPRLYYLKRMAICSILNEEKDLANKYLTQIGKVPFENDFVETYQPLVDNPELIRQNPSFAKVLDLLPKEQRFEQNYRSPAFLGYYIGMLEGSNTALAPSIAACLYSKDLPNMAVRAIQYKKMTGALPLSVQEALSIHARKRPEIYDYFPELKDNGSAFINPATASVNNFFLAIQDLFRQKYNNAPDWRERMGQDLKNGISPDLREKLEADWLGHYVYYYYCENITSKSEQKKTETNVN